MESSSADLPVPTLPTTHTSAPVEMSSLTMAFAVALTWLDLQVEITKGEWLFWLVRKADSFLGCVLFLIILRLLCQDA